ncbi:MAG: hypothetical protein IPM36_09645 [Lewinellaceae bacterium]|nr:hypothetical protein [Lewinellaceae bacterium]
MKILLHTLLVLIIASVSLPLNAVNQPKSDVCQLESNEIPFKIKISIDFGRRSKGCLKFGICNITVTIEERIEPRTQGAIGMAWMENNQLRIEFDKTTMTASTFQKYLDSQLLIEEDFELPTEVAKALGVTSYTIRAGSYPIQNSPDANLLPVQL